jgi:hypothetical protein
MNEMHELTPGQRRRPIAGLALAMAATTGCSPILDWRAVPVAGTGLVIEMPCKPDKVERPVPLAGAPVRLVLQACDAGDQTWGIVSADMVDPKRVGPALAALKASAAANIGASVAQSLPFQPKGAAMHIEAGQLLLDGTRTQGGKVKMAVALFARGTQVFQMTVLGADIPSEALDTFLGSPRFNP